ncbi:transposase [Porticoccus sp. W117]|uniref:transposase n=1 Tax=Porticoccus sp. W117 TaxID=3054777 RepID=UPI002593A5A0|nr:transposase [Porticoccus sp. W117]MDM3872260.1 transposase [Porticoccus sp. W117]
MPRKARILVPNCPHHIVQRGHNRQAVFLSDEDYQFYLENLKEWKVKLGVRVYAWCLMTNHIHLLVEPTGKTETLSELMKRLAGRQAAYTNKQERRSGSLWEGRFKASPVQRDNYLLSCIRYIELNPVVASMVSLPEDYRWSSYGERSGNKPLGLLDYDVCYLGLADSPSERLRRYRSYLLNHVSPEELKLIRSGVQRNQLTGNERFVDEIERRLGLRLEQRGRGRPRKEK